MKIVDVCAFYAPRGGGVRTYVDRKLVAGPEAGHDITVIAPGDADRVEQRSPRARVVWLESPRFPLDRNYRYFPDEAVLHRAISAEAPDIVEASSPWRSASMVGRWPGAAPRALIMHADPLAAFAYRWFEGVASRETVDRRFEWYWRHLLRLDARFDMTVSASDSLSRRLGAGGLKRIVTNPMGSRPRNLSPDLRDEELRTAMLRECGLGSDATLLLGVGRHAPEKRWPMVIDAVTAASYARPIGLLLVGGGRDTAKLRRQIAGNPHIRLVPAINGRVELARLMASSDALIHGCEAETFCMVAAEALASGLPLIVPDLGGAADHARAAGGHLYASGDAASAAEAIRRAIDVGTKCGINFPSASRTMDCHFSELFDRYQTLAHPMRRAA